jgi:hypothetical protein
MKSAPPLLAAVLIWSILLGSSVRAEEESRSPSSTRSAIPSSRRKKISVYEPLWSSDTTLDILTGVFGQSRFDSAANPQNLVLRTPSSAQEIELRPNLKLEFLPAKSALVLKPRIRTSFVQYEIPEEGTNGLSAQSRGELNAYFNEGYLRVSPISHLEISVGIINYQWGPSEVLSPSQFMFPELILKPDPFQEIRGVEAAKFEVQASQEWTITAMTEFPHAGAEHDDALNYQPRIYRGQALLRTEFAQASGELLLGAVAGKKQTGETVRGVGGAYGFWNYNRGGQLYFDYIGQQGSERLWVDSNGVPSQQESDLNSLYSVGVVGNRYAFENGLELKFEYIRNEFGIGQDARNLALTQIRKGSANSANFIAFLQDRTGPLPGTQYGYAAFRIDDPIGLKSLFRGSRLILRDLFSLTDETQAVSITFESALTDHFAQSLVAALAFGQNDGELTNSTQAFVSYYLKYSF